MATANRPPVPVPPNLAKIKDPDTRMALQAIMDGWSVRNGWVGSGDNKFLTKADLEGYLSDPANAAFLSQVTGASGGSGGSGSGNGGLAYDQIKELSDWIKTTWLWKTLHELIPDIYSNTGLKKAVETLSSSVGAVDLLVKTLDKTLVNTFSLLGISATKDGVLTLAGGFSSLTASVENTISAWASKEDGVFAKLGEKLSAVNTTVQALIDPKGTLATSITTLQTNTEKNTASLQQAFLVSTTQDSGTKIGYTVKAQVLNQNHGVTSAGFGLSIEQQPDSTYRSIFLVGANTFGIYDPAKSTNTGYVLPFMVNNGTVYINDALINSLEAAKITGDVNKISPVKGPNRTSQFGNSKEAPGWTLVHLETLPANKYGHQHFAMVTATARIGTSLDGVFVKAIIVDDTSGAVSEVNGFSNTNTMGGVTVTVAGRARSTSTATLQVWAMGYFNSGTMESLGGICGGLR